MTAKKSEGDALFRDPLPRGFSRRVLRIEPGFNLGPGCLHDAIVVVEEGELEVECRSGTSRRFGRGSMIAVAPFLTAGLRSVGTGPLVLVAVSRASLPATDEFLREPGSYFDC